MQCIRNSDPIVRYSTVLLSDARSRHSPPTSLIEVSVPGSHNTHIDMTHPLSYIEMIDWVSKHSKKGSYNSEVVKQFKLDEKERKVLGQTQVLTTMLQYFAAKPLR